MRVEYPIFLFVLLAAAIGYSVLAWFDYRAGVRERRRHNFKRSDWSRWTEKGWNAEDRRRRRL